MKIKRGTIIESDFGKGPVVAITKSWVIHEDERGKEYALLVESETFWIPAEVDGVDIPSDVELEI